MSHISEDFTHKMKGQPPKIRSIGFQMYHHINNGDISPNQPENPLHLLTRLGTSRVSKRRVSGQSSGRFG